ncbi:PAS domain S-box protein, partial [bacterium]
EAEKALAREREEAAERVEEERRRLRQIVDNLPIGLFVFDRERRIVQANEEGLSSFGLSLAQMEARDYAEAFYIEADGSEMVVDVEQAPLRRVLRGESGREPRIMRLRYPGADPAEDRFIRAEAAPLTDAEGQIEGAVFTVTNVKPLREAELALNREREAATERLMATLEGISIFVWLLDLDGRIVWCNRTFLDATGLQFADVENVQFWKGSWTEHDPDMAMRLGEATCDAAGGQASFFPVTARSVTGIMDVDVSLTPIFDETRTVKYLVASGMEVTQRNQAIRQIEDARMSAERAREIAERATRAKDEFLAVLSHELRTPLTPAMLGLELLVGDLDEVLPNVRDADLAASIQETMGSVRSNLEIQVRLIDDLLDVTRIARGKLELRKVPVDVHEAARHALSIVTPAADEKGITLSMTPSATRATVSADPARLRQILWNLLANAVKFTNPGGTIRLETEDAGRGMLRLKVIDDGLGIDAERLATIFDAFDQGDGTVSRGFGGLGLGLA